MIAHFSNPGTDKNPHPTRRQAAENMKQFVADCGLNRISFRATPRKDYDKTEGDGRFAFVMSRTRWSIEIQMPGIPLQTVRYTGGDAFGFRRLYVNGNSWLWEFAVKEVFRVATEESRWRETLPFMARSVA